MVCVDSHDIPVVAIVDAELMASMPKTLAAATSLGLGAAPGGLAVDLATTVTDLGQFYGHLLVIMQKLMYLY